MSQITHGLRSIFSNPRIYDAFQNLLGAAEIRKDLVRNQMRLSAGMRVLDIGCGTAEIINFLPPDVDYWGFDISAAYIDAAKVRFGARGNFHCGMLDSQQVSQLPKFDLVIALGVLHHLSDIEADGLFKLAKAALRPAGRVVTIDPCFVSSQSSIAHFLIASDRGRNVRDQDGYRALPLNTFEVVNGFIRRRSRIPYTEWVMECSNLREE